MSECRQEGAWRAYLDGELPPEEMALAGEHLKQCAACAELHRELAGRASRVGMLMADLAGVPEPGLLKTARARPRWIWAAGGLAAAAALAAAFAFPPRRHSPAVPVRAAVVEAPPPPVVEPVRPIIPAAAAGRIPRARPVRHRAQPRPQYFMALDEEPIDTGTVMRVSLAGGVEADVIVDSEGRPRAIRAVQ